MRAFTIIILLAGLGSAHSATYYVATTGNDSNDGSLGSKWLTVQKAADTMVAGDTVMVQAGNYGTEWVLTKANGTASNYIRFIGVGSPIIGGFDIAHGYQLVSGFDIRGTNATSNVPVTIEITGHDSVVQSNVFQLAPQMGQFGMQPYDFVYRPSNIVVAYNRFLDSSLNCMSFAGRGHLVYSNHFEKTANLVPGTSSDGDLWVCNASNCRFFGNYVTNWNRPTIDAHCDLVQSFSNNGEIATNNVIEGNTFLNCIGTQFGNVTDDGSQGRISHWTWRNNVYANIEAQMSLTAPNCDFFNNTFYKVGTTGVGPILFRTNSPAQGAAHNCRVYNNIFVECGDATRTDLGWWGFVDTPTNFISGGNLVIGTGAGTTKIGFTNGVNGQDPLLANPATLNFRLLTNSPCIGTATNLNAFFTTDIIGTTRGSAWDIGAYEYAAGGGGGTGTNTVISGPAKIKGKARFK